MTHTSNFLTFSSFLPPASPLEPRFSIYSEVSPLIVHGRWTVNLHTSSSLRMASLKILSHSGTARASAPRSITSLSSLKRRERCWARMSVGDDVGDEGSGMSSGSAAMALTVGMVCLMERE